MSECEQIMFGNLREFISVVQDGLSTNSNIRHTLQEVQKVKNIFREKQRSSSESKVNFGVGGDLLNKYQEQWAELHANAEMNAKAAEEVDKIVIELHETAKSRLKSATEMAQNLTMLPNLTASVAECLNSLKNVQSLLTTLEQDLVEFEDLVERHNMEKWKLDHQYQLSVYKEKKMVTLEEVRSKLAREDSERRMEAERQKLAELQAKRENSAAAFENDLAYYLSSGHIPRPAPTPNLELEQIQLEDNTEDLEKFLDS